MSHPDALIQVLAPFVAAGLSLLGGVLLLGLFRLLGIWTPTPDDEEPYEDRSRGTSDAPRSRG